MLWYECFKPCSSSKILIYKLVSSSNYDLQYSKIFGHASFVYAFSRFLIFNPKTIYLIIYLLIAKDNIITYGCDCCRDLTHGYYHYLLIMYCVIPIDQTNLDIAFKESYTFHEIVFDYITMYIYNFEMAFISRNVNCKYCLCILSWIIVFELEYG